jgi:hypothetical protein
MERVSWTLVVSGLNYRENMDRLIVQSVIRRSPLTRWLAGVKDQLELRAWQSKANQANVARPGLLKRRDLLAALRGGKLTHFVETGTLLGDTTHVFAAEGCTVYSIEVEPRLVALARARFKGNPNVHIVEGDSGIQMVEIIRRLAGAPALFWLDGHYSGGATGRGELDTPVIKEVETILNNAAPTSIVFIDDARCFGVEADYPTLVDMKELVEKHGVSSMSVRDDLISFTVPART